MKTVLTLMWLATLAGLAADAPVAQSNSNVVASAVLTPEESATAGRLNESLIGLKAKSALLLSLAEEHLKRSEQAAGLNQTDKARWEQELATELHSKNSLLSKQLSELNLEQTKIDQAHGSPAATHAGGSEVAQGLESDELVYLAKLNEKLAAIEQDLAAAIEEAQNYALQLQTNTTPDHVQSVSLSLEENKRTLKELRREQSELELKKLEFWAYHRRK